MRATGFVQGELTRRQQAHRLHRIQRALAVDIEGAQRVDGLVVEFDAIGQGAAHRKQVDEATSHAVLARCHHLRDVRVAGGYQLGAQRLDIESRPRLEKERVRGEVGGRRQPVKCGGGRDHRDIELPALQVIERCQAFGDQVRVR